MLVGSRRGGGRKRTRGGARPLGSSSQSRPGRLLRLVFQAYEKEGNGVGGGMELTGDQVKTGGGSIVIGTGCIVLATTRGLTELPCSQVIPIGEGSLIGNLMAHPAPGTKSFSSSNTSKACQSIASSRVPPTQPQQLDIGRSYHITTTAVPMPAC